MRLQLTVLLVLAASALLVEAKKANKRKVKKGDPANRELLEQIDEIVKQGKGVSVDRTYVVAEEFHSAPCE